MAKKGASVSRAEIEDQLAILEEAYQKLADWMNKDKIGLVSMIKIARTLRYLSDGIEHLKSATAKPGGVSDDDMDEVLEQLHLNFNTSRTEEPA